MSKIDKSEQWLLDGKCHICREAAEKQTFIFMKALNAGNKKDNSEE